MPDLAGIHIGLRRHDIVERRQAEPAAGQQEDAEILRVPVRGAQQPEHDLGFEKQGLVGLRLVTGFEQVENLPHAGAAVGLVLGSRRHGERLAAILLRQAQQAAVARVQAVKPLDHKRPPAGEFPYLRAGRRQSHGRGQAHAEMFVLDALREVDPVRQPADFGFEDVRGRRAPWGTCH